MDSRRQNRRTRRKTRRGPKYPRLRNRILSRKRRHLAGSGPNRTPRKTKSSDGPGDLLSTEFRQTLASGLQPRKRQRLKIKGSETSPRNAAWFGNSLEITNPTGRRTRGQKTSLPRSRMCAPMPRHVDRTRQTRILRKR